MILDVVALETTRKLGAVGAVVSGQSAVAADNVAWPDLLPAASIALTAIWCVTPHVRPLNVKVVPGVEPLPARARIEPRVAPRRLRDHAARGRRLVIVALALLQAGACRSDVIGRYAARAQVLLEPAPPRCAPACA